MEGRGKESDKKKIMYFWSGFGTKYTDSNFKRLCEEHDIQRDFSVRKTLQQNGVSERKTRSLTEKARCILLNVELSKGF